MLQAEGNANGAVTNSELLRLYDLMFKTWRWQVDSNWNRTGYFAVFEVALLGGVWEISSRGHTISGFVGALLGFVLTIVWLLNDIVAGNYIAYWWKSLSKVESYQKVMEGQWGLDFVSRYNSNADEYGIKRCDWVRYRYLTRAVPVLFMVAWAYCAAFAVIHYCRVCWR